MGMLSIRHLTTFWLTTLIFGLVVTILLLFVAALKPLRYEFMPKCKHLDKRSPSNLTTIFLVHTADKFEQIELEALEKILQSYPNYLIHITVFQQSTRKLSDKQSTITKMKIPTKIENIIKVEDKASVRRPKREIDQNKNLRFKHKFFDWYDDIDFNINIGSKKLLNLLMKKRMENELLKNKTILQSTSTEPPRITSLECLISSYPSSRIVIKNTTAAEFFSNTPLQYSYTILKPGMVIFSARVLKLWDYGGISFQLPKVAINVTNSSSINYLRRNSIEDVNKKIFDLISIGYTSYESLPEGIVTVDDEGLHLETKTTCHAFFGEVLMNLRRATRSTTPSSIIRKTLQTFCRKNAVDNSYCDNIAS